MRNVLAFVLFSLAASAAAQEGPPIGAYLRYRYSQHLEGGTGAYDGYYESTSANARYDIVSVEGDVATIRGQYSWRYSSPDRNEQDTEDRTVAFSVSTRRYLQRQTDSSDYDEQDGTQLSTWIWIPTGSSEDTMIAILEHPRFRVVGSERLVVAGNPLTAIKLRAEYNQDLTDAYGVRSSSIVDEYWFHAETGMFLREHMVEESTGTTEGSSFTFRLVTDITTIDASYAPNAIPVPDDFRTPPAPVFDPPTYDDDDYDAGASGEDYLCCAIVILVPVLAIGLVLFMVIRGRRKKANPPRQSGKGERFTIRGDPKEITGNLSPMFDPFIAHMAQVALKTGNKIAVARSEAGNVLGVALGDRDTQLGTIFAPDSDVCEALRHEIGHTEFFSEVRHPKLASVKALNIAAPDEAYNLYETFEVMSLEQRPEDLGYDTALVSPYKDKDRAGTVQLLSAVYGVACEQWLDASLLHGDLAWVAHEGETVIGLAMATLIGTNARLHTLTVHPDHQNKGIGTALYRARLRGLFDIGATRVITECATWNVAALEIARAHGFHKSGVMYVESARDQRAERKFVRR
jgi:GNAT superfamily N-acetyltransferase